LGRVRKSTRALIAWILVLTGMLAYAAVWTYGAYGRYAQQLSALDGIALGDRRGDVRYKLGDPPIVYANQAPGASGSGALYTDPQKDPAVPAGADLDSYHKWSYDNGSGSASHLDISFDAEPGRVSRIDCFDRSDSPTGYCSRVLGAGVGDPDSRIVTLLGMPTRQSIDDKSGVKTMDYDDLGLEFLLARQHVYALSLVAAAAPRRIALTRFLMLAANDLKSALKL
jgi:hypothetical protein